MLSLNPWNILWTVVNLLVLYAIFKKFLFQPVMNVIHQREEMIQKQFADARDKEQQALQMKADYEQQIQGAKTEADQIIKDAKVRAQEEYDKKIDEAAAQSEHMMEKTKSALAAEEDRAAAEAQARIAELALLAAEKIMKTGGRHDAGSSK